MRNARNREKGVHGVAGRDCSLLVQRRELGRVTDAGRGGLYDRTSLPRRPGFHNPLGYAPDSEVVYS